MRKGMWATALVCSAVMGMLAQGKPDFSGTWEMDLDRTRAENAARSGRAVTGGGGGGTGGSGAMGSGNAMAPTGAAAVTAVKITQTPTAMTISRVSGQVYDKNNFHLDGTEAVTVIANMTRKQKSRWDGNKLVSEGSGETVISDGSGIMKATFKEVRWIDADGTMVVESTVSVQPPPGMQLGYGGAPRTSVQCFTKK